MWLEYIFFSKFGATCRNVNHQLFSDMQKKVKRVRHANVDLFDGYNSRGICLARNNCVRTILPGRSVHSDLEITSSTVWADKSFVLYHASLVVCGFSV